MSRYGYDNHFSNGREDEYTDFNDNLELDGRANKFYKQKSKPPRYFTSNIPQTLIRNAVTGVEYPYLVGSKEQSLLYKIVDATGRCDKDGYVIRLSSELPNPNTNHLFYDSPEQCIAHLHFTLNPEDVKRWHNTHSGHIDN